MHGRYLLTISQSPSKQNECFSCVMDLPFVVGYKDFQSCICHDLKCCGMMQCFSPAAEEVPVESEPSESDDDGGTWDTESVWWTRKDSQRQPRG